MATSEESDPSLRRLDPRSLRGLAHPLRVRLLGSLREQGPATASGLAARLGESSGATSYHLRQLEAYGWVEEDSERGTARERWWKPVHRGTLVDSVGEFTRHPDADVRGAIDTYMHEVATIHAQDTATWLATMREWPEEWQEAWTVSDASFRLTPELVHELTEKAIELIESYRGRVTDDDPRAERVRFHLHAFPREEGRS